MISDIRYRTGRTPSALRALLLLTLPFEFTFHTLLALEFELGENHYKVPLFHNIPGQFSLWKIAHLSRYCFAHPVSKFPHSGICICFLTFFFYVTIFHMALLMFHFHSIGCQMLDKELGGPHSCCSRCCCRHRPQHSHPTRC